MLGWSVRVLLDAGRAKAHKAGYYVRKSSRGPEPQGKQAALRAQGWTLALGCVTTTREYGYLWGASTDQNSQLI